MNQKKIVSRSGQRGPRPEVMTQRRYEFLKAVHTLNGGEPVAQADLARELDVSKQRIFQVAKILEEYGLLKHKIWLKITAEGLAEIEEWEKGDE